MRVIDLLASAAVLTAGCAAPVRPVIQLMPRGKPIWSDGRAWVSTTEDSLRVAIAFERSSDALLVFDVQVENRSDEPLVFDPMEFRCSSGDHGPATAALDPESQILSVDRRAAELEAQRTQELGLDALSGLLDVVGLVANFGESKSEQEQEVEEERQHEKEAASVNDADRYERSKAELAEERRLWAESALRRTTLRPGDSRRGFVFFARIDGPSSLVVHAIVGKRDLTVAFESRPTDGSPNLRPVRRSVWD